MSGGDILTPSLLAALRCPESGQPLALADTDTLAALNRRLAGGGVTNRAGTVVDTPLESGLLREDGTRLYPVRDGFPLLLVDEAIAIGD